MLTDDRDTEDSAPAQYPPEQPEADVGIDDGLNYGAEEVELEEGLKAELAQLPPEEDEEMDGAADTAGAKAEDDDESDAGSEDLEAESSGSEDEDEEVEEADEDMDMVRRNLCLSHDMHTDDHRQGEDGETAAQGQANGNAKGQPAHPQHQGEVMVH